jgi:hypothetical protein
MIGTVIVVVLLLGILAWTWTCAAYLRYIAGQIGDLSSTVQRFINDCRRVNDFEERLNLELQVRVDAEQSKSFAKWRTEHPESAEYLAFREQSTNRTPPMSGSHSPMRY